MSYDQIFGVFCCWLLGSLAAWSVSFQDQKLGINIKKPNIVSKVSEASKALGVSEGMLLVKVEDTDTTQKTMNEIVA